GARCLAGGRGRRPRPARGPGRPVRGAVRHPGGRLPLTRRVLAAGSGAPAVDPAAGTGPARMSPDPGGAGGRPGADAGGVLILGILAFGFIVGWLAQLVLGMGTKPDGRTLVAGLVGSLVGGLLVSLLAGDGLALRPSGLIGSFVGAIVVLAIWSRVAPATR